MNGREQINLDHENNICWAKRKRRFNHGKYGKLLKKNKIF